MSDFQNGTIVKAHYKSGIYIGEVIEDRKQNYLVKILAVDKHPMQGDLHNPGKTDDVFFHQRKALSFQEKANIHKQAVHLYESKQVPDYDVSLKQSVEKLKQKLTRRETNFNQHALDQLKDLENQYFS
ncbi:kinase-associated lipoprotein B [Halobacillus hunanensis]|uniref:kinase-associated lipoprotein B n=1 Tax=Halobacillus hunanensis TaxID=578214 RepID=UPI0009A62B0F|nr:kinase-associated lipoprotein B [Halobacillus hunanensis]